MSNNLIVVMLENGTAVNAEISNSYEELIDFIMNNKDATYLKLGQTLVKQKDISAVMPVQIPEEFNEDELPTELHKKNNKGNSNDNSGSNSDDNEATVVELDDHRD